MRRAEDLFNEIESRYASGESDFRADTSVYNALINCEALVFDSSFLPYSLLKHHPQLSLIPRLRLGKERREKGAVSGHSDPISDGRARVARRGQRRAAQLSNVLRGVRHPRKKQELQGV